jgi:hypothetical protein
MKNPRLCDGYKFEIQDIFTKYRFLIFLAVFARLASKFENQYDLKTGLRIHIHFIRIQHFRLNTDPDPDPIRIQGFNDQKF